MKKAVLALDFVAFTSLLVLWGIPILVWNDLPERVPMHFGFSGQANGWGPKSSILFLLFAGTFLWILMTIANRFPHRFNFPVQIRPENQTRQYEIARVLMSSLKAEILLAFGIVVWAVRETAFGRSDGVGGMFMPGVLLALSGTIGVYLFTAKKLG